MTCVEMCPVKFVFTSGESSGGESEEDSVNEKEDLEGGGFKGQVRSKVKKGTRGKRHRTQETQR